MRFAPRLSALVPSLIVLAACGGSDRSPLGSGQTPSGKTPGPSQTGDFAAADPKSGGPTPGVCSPQSGNYDVPGNNCDDDADGSGDNVAPCDGGLPVTGDAAAFVRALGL